MGRTGVGVQDWDQMQQKAGKTVALLFVGVMDSSKCFQTAIITYYTSTIVCASKHCNTHTHTVCNGHNCMEKSPMVRV